MKRSVRFLSVITLCLFFAFAAGCTQPGSTQTGGPAGSTVTAEMLPSLALTPPDAPANYTFVESREKSIGDVGAKAADLGWSGGYEVTYSGYPDDPMGETVITQTIALYQEDRIQDILAIVKATDRSDSELIITDLPSPGLGDGSFAFFGKAPSQIILRPKTGEPFDSGTLVGSFKQDIAEIVFIKGPVLEVIKMTGPHADDTVLRSLASEAYAKLP